MEIPSRPLLLVEAPDGATDYYTLCTAVCGFHGAPNVTRSPPVAAPRDALAALDRRKFRPRPPKRCAPRRDPCHPPIIASSNVAFPQMSPAPRYCPCPLPGVVYTPLDAVMPLSKHRMCPLCVIGFQKCVGFIGNTAPYVSFGFSLSGVLCSRSALYITPVR